ncbi:MAG: hypothetical protein N3B15_00715 [Planctomycetota bacterium]|nr:hypothetical protein [Planctomycetota bacterium]MCX8039090.1 hypothetical protein [Planctomycetota bacterium]
MRWAGLAACVLLCGCATSRAAAVPDRWVYGEDEAAAERRAAAETIERHLAQLEQRIAELERAQRAHGRGAYRAGSLLRVIGRSAPGSTPLEQLRQLEQRLAEAEAALAARDRRIAELRAELERAQAQGTELREQVGDLSYTREALTTAQQALAEAQARAEDLMQQLAASELARLRAEREHFRLAAAVLRLSPGQTTRLLELQEEAREAARRLEPPAAPARPEGKR